VIGILRNKKRAGLIKSELALYTESPGLNGPIWLNIGIPGLAPFRFVKIQILLDYLIRLATEMAEC
jgi:hypothetical protein